MSLINDIKIMINKNELMNGLRKNGFFYQENIFDKEFVKLLKNDLSIKSLSKAGVGSCKEIKSEIRSDQICWLEQNDNSIHVQKYFSFINELKQDFNKNFFLGLKDFESHFAQYDAGTFYKPHKDNLRGKNNRIVTIIMYLNENWKEEDGGKLRIHTNEIMDIEPIAGSVVVFMSEEILHEVLPSNNKRQAITGWLLN